MTRSTWVGVLLVSSAVCGCGGGSGTDVDAASGADGGRDGGVLDGGADAGSDAGLDATPPVDVGSDASAACDLDHDHHLASTTECGGDDCDDAVASTHPGQGEVCNGVDDDCNAQIDDGVAGTFYRDADGDGFGDPTMTALACHVSAGYASIGTDCDDAEAAVHPGAAEACDAIDNDCTGVVDDAPGGCACTPGSTRACAGLGRCASGIETCVTGAWSACSIGPVAEACNGVDDDCDGIIDNGCG